MINLGIIFHYLISNFLNIFKIHCWDYDLIKSLKLGHLDLYIGFSSSCRLSPLVLNIISQNKWINPSFNSSISIGLFSFNFSWHCVDSIMIDDATTSLKPLKLLVYDEKLVEMPLDVTVSQWLHDEKPAKKVITWVNYLPWDH